MSRFKWKFNGISIYELDEPDLDSNKAFIVQQIRDGSEHLWRGFVESSAGKSALTDWLPLEEAIKATEDLMAVHGIVPMPAEDAQGVTFQQALDRLVEASSLDDEAARNALRNALINVIVESTDGQLQQHGVKVTENTEEASEPEPLTIDEYMYQRELEHPARAGDYRSFAFVPLDVTRSDGVEVNAERNGSQPCVAMRIISSVDLFLYGKQRLPESVFLTPRQARELAELLLQYAHFSEENCEAEYSQARLDAETKIGELRWAATNKNALAKEFLDVSFKANDNNP